MSQNTLSISKSNSFENLISFKGIFFTTVIFLFTVAFSSAIAQCNATLEVQKNRSFKSASSKQEATFKMSLKNTSSQSGVFTINTENISKTCANTTYPSKAANVELKASIVSTSSVSTTSKKVAGESVKLAAGETYEFLVTVNVPPNTSVERWSCIEVSAVAAGCRATVGSTILSVYVSDPADSE